MSGTICWYCDNCCGKCSWSKNFTPVDGWEAKKTKVAKRIDSYIVDECPKFVLSYSKILTSKEFAALLNITTRTLCRIGKRDFYSLCKNAGIDAFPIFIKNKRFYILKNNEFKNKPVYISNELIKFFWGKTGITQF